MQEFKLPDLGEGVHEGQVVRLCVREGEAVSEDQPLMEVETDKASVEIPSPFSGRVAKWHVSENELVHVGDTMVSIDSEGAAAAGKIAGSQRTQAGTGGASGTGSSGAASSPASTTIGPSAPGTRRASPAVRKLARQRNIDINSITGTGPNGRITRADVEDAANGRGAAGSTAATIEGSASPGSKLPVTPVNARPVAPSRPTTPTEVPAGRDETDQYGPVRRVPNSMARKTIAANMAQSWSTIVHVTDCQDADITHLDKIRRGYRAPENDERQLTILSFVIRAVAQALVRHPVFNSVFDGANESVVYRRYINIAIGVHTRRGLITPVIRNADQLSIREIAAEVDTIAAKARGATFDVSDLRGGTYTISNVGAVGSSHYSTPIIVPGTCAVLALGRARLQPWVVDGEIVPRLILPLSHSFDHRVADGGDEVAFLGDVVGGLENPARILI